MPAPVSFLVSRFPNPSETFIQAQAEGLMERGAAVEIVALAEGPGRAEIERRFPALKLTYVPLPKTLPARIAALPAAFGHAAARKALDVGRFGDDAASLRLAVAASRWPASREPRVWLAHYGRWGAFACALRELGLIAGPVATVFHGKDMSAYLRKRPDAYRSLFGKGDLFLPISDAWREKLLALGAPPSRTFVHRMGVDASRFVETPRTLAAGEPVRFIGVGRMVEKKGFDDAIAAFARVRAEGVDASLTLIGEGKLRTGLEAQAAPLGAAVRFTGVLPHADVAAELTRAHVFVLPSKTAASGDMEGIPVALMEAMAAGMPVISTRHSGIPELIEHDVSGLLCAEGDRDALAANMLALSRAPELWPQMGAAGAARVRAEFDLKRWNDLLFERLVALS